ncbi:MAG: type VI secretion system tube protein Hcp [Acetobacteraceae bacterium]|nr:type VI secretion system tube protein Hcp [Acetobacteraceae bacterium]
MGMYMKFADIKGDVTTDGYKDWIAISSFQFGIGRGISSGEGRGGNRTASHASVSEITVTKQLDESSLSLWSDALTGPLKAEVEVKITTATDNKTILEVKLWETGVSGWSTSGGGDRPMESLSLNFTKIEYKPVFYDAKGTAATPKMKTWNLATLKLS